MQSNKTGHVWVMSQGLRFACTICTSDTSDSDKCISADKLKAVCCFFSPLHYSHYFLVFLYIKVYE